MRKPPQWLESWRAGTLAAPERKLGRLAVPSGAIVACDPLTTLGDRLPYTRTVQPGTYDVALGYDHSDVAFAVLRLDDSPVVTWEVARCEADTGVVPGFGVDAGMACFVDAQVARGYRATRDARNAAIAASIVASPEDAAAWHVEHARAQEAHADPLRDLTVHSRTGGHVKAMDGGNLIAFTSGAGDGCYPAFWGLAADGSPVVLIIDFGMLAAEDDDEQHDDDDEQDDPSGDVDSDDASARIRAKQLLERWERDELIVLTERAKRDELVDALAEDLAGLETDADVGAALSEWLMGRDDVADVFATDEQLAASRR